MNLKARVRRQYERRLRSQGNAKAWAVKQASLATTNNMLAALPFHVQIKVLLAAGSALTIEKAKGMLGMRSGE